MSRVAVKARTMPVMPALGWLGRAAAGAGSAAAVARSARRRVTAAVCTRPLSTPASAARARGPLKVAIVGAMSHRRTGARPRACASQTPG